MLDSAATSIQAAYRGKKARTELKEANEETPLLGKESLGDKGKHLMEDSLSFLSHEADVLKSFAGVHSAHVSLDSKQYDPDQPLSIILTWAATVWPLVLYKLDTQLWFLLYFVVEFAHEWEYITLPAFPFQAITISTGLMAFFLVFYNAEAYTRFRKLYEASTQIGGAVKAFSQRAIVSMKHDPGAAWQASRYLVASMACNFYFLADGKHAISEEEWQTLLDQKLLTPKELQWLRTSFTGRRYELLHVWALEVSKQALCPNGEKPGFEYFALNEQIFIMRTHQAYITNMMKMPIPFAYCHLLNMMIMLNYIAIGYVLILIEGTVASAIFVIAVVIITGIRELSAVMHDPFGFDEIDFPIPGMILSCYREVRALSLEKLEDMQDLEELKLEDVPEEYRSYSATD